MAFCRAFRSRKRKRRQPCSRGFLSAGFDRLWLSWSRDGNKRHPSPHTPPFSLSPASRPHQVPKNCLSPDPDQRAQFTCSRAPACPELPPHTDPCATSCWSRANKKLRRRRVCRSLSGVSPTFQDLSIVFFPPGRGKLASHKQTIGISSHSRLLRIGLLTNRVLLRQPRTALLRFLVLALYSFLPSHRPFAARATYPRGRVLEIGNRETLAPGIPTGVFCRSYQVTCSLSHVVFFPNCSSRCRCRCRLAVASTASFPSRRIASWVPFPAFGLAFRAAPDPCSPRLRASGSRE